MNATKILALLILLLASRIESGNFPKVIDFRNSQETAKSDHAKKNRLEKFDTYRKNSQINDFINQIALESKHEYDKSNKKYQIIVTIQAGLSSTANPEQIEKAAELFEMFINEEAEKEQKNQDLMEPYFQDLQDLQDREENRHAHLTSNKPNLAKAIHGYLLTKEDKKYRLAQAYAQRQAAKRRS